MRRRTFAVMAIGAALAACAPPVVVPPESAAPTPAEFPGAYYQALRAQGKPVLRIDPARSLVTVVVRRAGSLAQLGHDHVVASHDVSGFVAPGEGRADLFVPLATLAVDESALRTDAGFTTQPSAADIAGTRSNMLTRVLDADRFPFVRIAVRGRVADSGAATLSVGITMHGVTRTLNVPVRFENANGDLGVDGTLAIAQTDFRIAPFSILGGAIAVQDGLELAFRIRARPME